MAFGFPAAWSLANDCYPTLEADKKALEDTEHARALLLCEAGRPSSYSLLAPSLPGEDHAPSVEFLRAVLLLCDGAPFRDLANEIQCRQAATLVALLRSWGLTDAAILERVALTPAALTGGPPSPEQLAALRDRCVGEATRLIAAAALGPSRDGLPPAGEIIDRLLLGCGCRYEL